MQAIKGLYAMEHPEEAADILIRKMPSGKTNVTCFGFSKYLHLKRMRQIRASGVS